jgi:hypothetical protein|tara:strand:- start:265 stop:702 length:438 start_codon:yes stop_codon:yes gene_type:complete
VFGLSRPLAFSRYFSGYFESIESKRGVIDLAVSRPFPTEQLSFGAERFLENTINFLSTFVSPPRRTASSGAAPPRPPVFCSARCHLDSGLLLTVVAASQVTKLHWGPLEVYKPVAATPKQVDSAGAVFEPAEFASAVSSAVDEVF